MAWGLRLLWLSVFHGMIAADDVREETECFAAGTFLEADCRSSPGLVISIDWSATFFGQSTCGTPSCCPDDTVCTVLVKDTHHFEDGHWDELNACNGQTFCEVQVERVGPGHACDLSTDYETVTYRCVPPHTTATEGTATERQTTQQTTTGVKHTPSSDSVVTVSGPDHPGTQTDEPVHQTTIDGGCECQSNDDVVIAVSVSLSLLLVLSTSLVGYICYKRGLANGAAGGHANKVKEVSDQYLTDLSPADSGNTVNQQTNNGQATSTYETMANSYYNEPSPEYRPTGLQLHQYENLNGSHLTNCEQSSVLKSTESNGTAGQNLDDLKIKDAATGFYIN